ncbi:MAG: hypothetical protein JAY90_20160 [Candidatus Thiodiazotropha lotti]|nr:hypothetical protein [Candidatus Thiodiazotropha lotti]
MNVNSTLDLLTAFAAQMDDPAKILLLREDIIQAMKFDLGDEFSDKPWFGWIDEKICVPQLPYDKVYFEAVSSDGKRYGALFENYGEYGVCGQMLVDATVENSPGIKGLFPISLFFTQDNDELRLHHNHDDELKDMQIEAIIALNLMVKAISVINCSNVKIIESPEKKLINKKRKAKGKLPLFTYKTLHIDIGWQEENRGETKCAHASPRVHLRRGHIRKLASGKTIWVQPCVVGDKTKGIVNKDYSVSCGFSA